MKRSIPRLSFFLLIVFTFFYPLFISQVHAAVWYVDSESTCTENCGTAWGTAFSNIQDAMNAAGNGDEIWVKGGTYLLSSQIVVDKDVSIYGGFYGNETQRDQRD